MSDNPDPALAYARLKAETAEMFNYDIANLSLTQGLQLDLVSLLRLEVDTMQGQVLAGEAVDLARLVSAHAMLAKLLPERALVAPAPAADAREDDAAYRQIAEMIDRLIAADQLAMARDPAAARAKFEANLQRAIENSNPGGGDVQSDSVVPLLPSPVVVAGCESAPVEPPETAPQTAGISGSSVTTTEGRNGPPAQTSLQPPLLPPDAPIPANYLKQADEPWRPYVSEYGISTTPWRR